jgi:hypothetical protein
MLYVVVEKPTGPHHCDRWFTSVNIFHTRSRGASKTRVILSSRSTVLDAFSLPWVICVVLQL